ncbi:ABC-2 transporter permease [Olsenella sp. Marseille-P4559]|uniref:ABC-2 transporter permease n=1 Tax=Olsenella sp. Marseille-P4559 TaxID=2364795 RepID=UPI0013EF131F|nr:ABC-2 transporter permease [Olsenella sp. Marseille-P4559]
MMKSLLLNEWFSFRHSLKALATMLVFAAVIFIPSFMEGSATQLIVPVCLVSSLLGGTIPFYFCIQVFAADEKSQWREALLALPTTPQGVVLARYLFCLMLLAICLSLSLVVDAVVLAASGSGPDLFISEQLFLIPMSILFIFLAILALLVPLLYAFGQRGYVAVLVFPLALGVAAPMLKPSIEPVVIYLVQENLSGLLVAILVVIGLVLYVISYLISTRIMKRRSF